MPNYNVKITNFNREEVIDYIRVQKNKNSNFKVVDVGGSVTSWSYPYIDALIDFNDSESNIKHFKCDITHPDSWKDILEYVKINGKFDFCICTHTLEDIMNPVYVCEQIQKISKEGYIAVPSKFRELSRIEGFFRGYIHHRWIFDFKCGMFIGFPKINYIENSLFNSIANDDENCADLSFFWKETIDIVYVNNNYLGPSADAVKNYYNLLIQ